TSSDHLDRRLRNTRKRPPQRGLVQVGSQEVISPLVSILRGLRASGTYPPSAHAFPRSSKVGAIHDHLTGPSSDSIIMSA
ncbi:MAG: hypothetical protein WA423_10150, partial [Candidatus Sulfotelmatobacter sp.]